MPLSLPFLIRLQSPSAMESEQQKPCNQPTRRQIVNFKQLLKINVMKKQRKEEQVRSIKQLRLAKKSQSKEECEHEMVRLPREVKIFKEVEVSSASTKHNKCFLFPSLHLKKDRKSVDTVADGSAFPGKRPDFLQKIKEISAERVNIVASKSMKKKAKSIHSQLNLPSKLICRSISPLANASISAQRLSLEEISEFKQSKQEKSTRYQDIPISEFLYDNPSSMRLLEKSLELKMEKAWRKKSKNTRSISVRN